ncbi:MAG: SagB/ThcOx family dehydrogenase [Candidatus Desulfofervidus auxilii]|nr:SagB/ThcOx family dehydrogenase [Candidatus Desulfofervidus auxilii]
MKIYQKGIGYRYLFETKYFRDRPLIDDLGLIASPPPYKIYPNARKIILPKPHFPPCDFWEIIAKRRSKRNYTKKPMDLKTLAHLLWASQGITSKSGYRAAPSAGALYPVETYLSIQNVENVDKGIYHFNILEFCLEELAKGDFKNDLTNAALGQGMVRQAAVVFIWTAVILRCMAKYRNRAIRYIFLDAGHICQNMLLAATALGLGACPIGAFFDEEIDRILGIDSENEMTIYIATVGRL